MIRTQGQLRGPRTPGPPRGRLRARGELPVDDGSIPVEERLLALLDCIAVEGEGAWPVEPALHGVPSSGDAEAHAPGGAQVERLQLGDGGGANECGSSLVPEGRPAQP
ncbi:hypothetical protein [Pyxidicoccus sp. MSG2]|uniref:hypothetical protein n=1 Tax=Pyxidicoccus sp. MSG2 TaxID=2996790 RepID=UPI00226FA693|nr:hypothetical protein [Pyxidicoccus sp. MSG2]MCY1015773.1 hypothetical protein [Pyxidicoccus sp. MSG2]